MKGQNVKNVAGLPVLGITGGVGAGKSTVLTCLRERYGALVLECDQIGRELQEKGGACYEAMRTLFGDGILDSEKNIDRSRVAEMIYREPALREQLNGLIHPAVKAEVIRRLEEAGKEYPFAAVEAALLLEDRYDEICDEIWYIHTDRDVRIRRLMASRGYTAEKCELIMAAQKPEVYYRSRCQLTVDNSGDDPAQAWEQIDRGLKEHGFLQHWQREQR
ncbi:MAG: dephospho-CoA kinase [Lachnospiraceae bacterium]|nr:dephospho-CoA kinase [Lachnospiraceae bacterium]